MSYRSVCKNVVYIVFFGSYVHHNVAVISQFGEVIRYPGLCEFHSRALCREVSNQGCNKGGKGGSMPLEPNRWVAPKSPNNVASFFFSVQYIYSEKALDSNMVAPNLFFAPAIISPRYALCQPRTLRKNPISVACI